MEKFWEIRKKLRRTIATGGNLDDPLDRMYLIMIKFTLMVSKKANRLLSNELMNGKLTCILPSKKLSAGSVNTLTHCTDKL